MLIAVYLVSSNIVSACAGDPRNGAGPIAPMTLQTSTAATAPLMIQVDTICAGRESEIRVYVDLVLVGVTNPGEAGVSETVTVGEHQLSAISQRGTLWGPFPTTVAAGGRMERLGCVPAEGI